MKTNFARGFVEGPREYYAEYAIQACRYMDARGESHDGFCLVRFAWGDETGGWFDVPNVKISTSSLLVREDATAKLGITWEY